MMIKCCGWYGKEAGHKSEELIENLTVDNLVHAIVAAAYMHGCISRTMKHVGNLVSAQVLNNHLIELSEILATTYLVHPQSSV